MVAVDSEAFREVLIHVAIHVVIFFLTDTYSK